MCVVGASIPTLTPLAFLYEDQSPSCCFFLFSERSESSADGGWTKRKRKKTNKKNSVQMSDVRMRVKGKEAEDASQQGKFGSKTRKPMIIKGIRRCVQHMWMTTSIETQNNVKIKQKILELHWRNHETGSCENSIALWPLPE